MIAHASHFHARGARPGRLQASFKENVIDYGRVLDVMRQVGYAGYVGVEYVWIDWEHCNEVDNLSETILMRDFLRSHGRRRMNQPDPALGVILHAIGGLASASFYLPFRGVKGWAWESYWLVGGVFSWVVAPWMFALLQIPELVPGARGGTARRPCSGRYLFGVLWGIGGLTFGLTMRYLGIALGMAMALGYCAAFGTLMPPLFRGELEGVARTTAGATVLFGVFVCLAGIVVSGLAGRSKERELTDEQKQAVIHEFSFGKGVLVATVSGILSACMSYGFAAGKPIADLAVQHGAHPLWQNLPVLVVVLAGGLTTNLLWCLRSTFRNGTAGDYLRSHRHGELVITEQVSTRTIFSVPPPGPSGICSSSSTGWGTRLMGKFEFSSWTLHMASIMIFGTLWGLISRNGRARASGRDS